MQFEFTEEQRMIADMVGDFAVSEGASEKVRAAMMTERGYSSETWQSMVQELALSSLLIPESAGGQNLSMVEAAIVFEQLGKTLLPSPLLSTAVLSVAVLNALEISDLLKQIAAGEITVTTAAVCSRKAEFVLDAGNADLILLFNEDNGYLYAVDKTDPRISIEPVSMLDQTRRLGHVTVSEFDSLRLIHDDAAIGFQHGSNCARIALAAEASGAAQTCLEQTVTYSKDRMQFGRAIGSFQAMKHQMADMMIEVEAAISAVYFAACAVAEGHAESVELAAMAKVQASEALSFCAGRMIQLHGGIGFTWEHDAHLYFKRARSTTHLFGGNTELDDMIAARIGLGVCV